MILVREIIITTLCAVPVGIVIGIFFRKYIAEARIAVAEEAANKILEEANREAESKRREIILESKEEVHKLRTEAEKEVRERRSELQRLERRLIIKEETQDKKTLALEKKEEQLVKLDDNLVKREKEIEGLYIQQVNELERLAGLSTEEAKTVLLNSIRKDVQHEAAILIREMENQAKNEADKRARKIVSLAIQRCAVDHATETTVSVVELPNDEMKGRIIGREGRNIRTFETLTGIDLIIDDTPEAVVLSGFDPVRREIARIALEKLVLDGRIHPTRIEEMIEKAKKDVANIIREEGERAVFEVGLHGIHPELVRLLGRLKYRTSYGQNVLSHSIEVAQLAGVMAAELGIDIKRAKRAGLLHDIGKALDHEIEGPHATIGADIAKKYGEKNEILHAIEAHHGDIELKSIVAVLVQASDAISAARPGARRETLENYIQRLTRLEDIASSFEGVDKSFAIQAGREIRIMVKPGVVNDIESSVIARDIAKKIEESLDYPGHIKVTVIRETRSVEYAK